MDDFAKGIDGSDVGTHERRAAMRAAGPVRARSRSRPAPRAARSGRTRFGAAVLAIASLAACQSHEPRPLDAAAHRAAWHARTLEDGSLAAFLERLEAEGQERIGFDPADGLSLREGRLVALVFHPDLRLARLGLARASASAEHAGRWADPELSFSVLSISESVPSPWIVTPGLTFSLPLSGRLAAEREQADAAERAAEARVIEAEWTVWHEVRRAWSEWSAARLRVEETERLVGDMESLVATARLLEEQGELARTETRLFELERAQHSNDLLRLRGELVYAEQEVRARLGLAPEAPVTFVPTLALDAGEAPGTPRSGSDDAVGDTERHPALARLRLEYEVAEAALAREIRAQYPDLSLGPLYESDEGRSSVGLLGALPLPFLDANRRAIAEARAERELARAAFEARYESLAGRRAAAAARAAALSEQRADMQEVLLPLIERQLEDARRFLRLGEGTSLVLLESLVRSHRARLELVEMRLAETLARTEIESLTGPPALAAPADPHEETP